MRPQTRRWGPFRQEWYSICSQAWGHDENCPRCAAGHWVNVWAHAVESVFYKMFPGVWRWWVNRPNSRTRRRLEKWFPGLRG